MSSKPKIIFPKPTAKEILADITAFLTSEEHEESFSALLTKRKQVIGLMQSIINKKGLTEDSLIEIIRSDDEAMNTIISLLGISQEEFYREVTFLRVMDGTFDKEWKMDKIIRMIRGDYDFAKEIARFILQGKDDEGLKKHIPQFTLNKLDKNKLSLKTDSLIDSLLRTGMKGRYDARKGSIVQNILAERLDKIGVEYEKGDVTVPKIDRRMNFVIPTVEKPYVLMECGIFITTAREMSEKGVLEMRIRRQVEENYPNSVLVRVTDGIGWLARGGKALSSVIDASHYVLTLKQIDKLDQIMKAHVPPQYFKTKLNNFQ